MLSAHTPPLTQAELLRLEQFLSTTACGNDAMGLSYAHGFLTAVASGPESLAPDEWMRLMFDDPVFANGADAREMLGLALRLFHEIERDLRSSDAYRPVFEFVRDAHGGTHADAQPWCRGFTAGLALFSEHWTRHAHSSLSTPLVLVSQLAKLRGQADASYGRLCAALPDAVKSVYRYWQGQNSRW